MALATWLPGYPAIHSSALRDFGLIAVYLSACPSGVEKLAGSYQSLNCLPTIRQLELVLFYFWI